MKHLIRGKRVRVVLALAALALALLAASCGQTGTEGDRGPTAVPSPTPQATAPADVATSPVGGHDHAAMTRAPEDSVVLSESVSTDKVHVQLSVLGRVDDEGGVRGTVAGSVVNVRVELHDLSTGDPIAPAQSPAVWIDLAKEDQDKETSQDRSCESSIRRYLQGSLGFKATNDLNSFYVLTMNEDATISVIDPMVNVAGMTQLYGMVDLTGPGADWALTSDSQMLFVSVPQKNQVVVADMESFDVFRTIDVGVNPTRVAVQPDGRNVWVGNDSSDDQSGVTVIDVATLRVVARIPTGKGQHQIAFSNDSRFALVTNLADGDVSIIDVQGLQKLGNISTGRQPVAAAFSSVTGLAYVADAVTGRVSVIDPASRRTVKQLRVGSGLKDFRLSHDGLWAFALDATEGRVHVLDLSSDRVTSSVPVVEEPEQLSVTHSYVYVRSSVSPDVSIIDHSKLAQGEVPESTRVTAGQGASTGSRLSSPADAIAPVHEHGDDVMIASLVDSYVYYYMAGMNAPAGGFLNTKGPPRAVRVLDRSIRQVGPGRYEATTLVRQSGEYRVALFLDSPRVTACFNFTAKRDPLLERTGRPLSLSIVTSARQATVGEPFHLQFRLSDQQGKGAVLGPGDVQVVVTLASGLWSERFEASPVSNGLYEVQVTLPRPGVYRVFFSVPSLRATFDQLGSVTLTAKDPG